ncbi:MAG: helix-turn-helix domain-containing protein [Deltaproteobacteria bacterium]
MHTKADDQDPTPTHQRSTAVAAAMPRSPSHVAPFVEALGAELAVTFLLQFGGAELTLSTDPKGQGMVERLVGHERAAILAATVTQKRIPLANKWLAQMLIWQGHSIAEVARKLRTTDVSIRRWIRVTSHAD